MKITFKMIAEETKEKLSFILQMLGNVTKSLNKGLSEADYKNALLIELQENGIHYTTEETIAITYKGQGIGFKRLDICVFSWFPIIFELKAVTTDIKAENMWQLLNYMISKNFEWGVVINFNQSAGKPCLHRFLFLEEGIPYIYMLESDTKHLLEGYSF